jgi:hypothetical protein
MRITELGESSFGHLTHKMEFTLACRRPVPVLRYVSRRRRTLDSGLAFPIFRNESSFPSEVSMRENGSRCTEVGTFQPPPVPHLRASISKSEPAHSTPLRKIDRPAIDVTATLQRPCAIVHPFQLRARGTLNFRTNPNNPPL